MTIAVSATIVRSRLLAVLCIAMVAVLSAAALQLRGTPALSFVCAIAAVGLALFPLSAPKVIRIDVTGIGQILLTDTRQSAVADRTDAAIPMVQVVQLREGSTLWSSLMVLRLQSASGQMYHLVLLPDSVGREAFRALSVACRWIAGRRPPGDA